MKRVNLNTYPRHLLKQRIIGQLPYPEPYYQEYLKASNKVYKLNQYHTYWSEELKEAKKKLDKAIQLWRKKDLEYQRSLEKAIVVFKPFSRRRNKNVNRRREFMKALQEQ